MGVPGKKEERSMADRLMSTTQPPNNSPSVPPPEKKPDKARPPEEDNPVSFVPRQPLYTFEQVILPESVRSQFQVLRSRISNHKLLYEDWELGKIDPQGRHIAFNLYGPPGTGKTMCVEAIASELGKDVIDISYAEIESKYVGETGKNITAAFQAAKEADAMLFFDEADSILGRRMTSVTQAADHGVNVARAVMLKQLDAFEGIVAFATNLSKNFDNAFVRRISQHIEIPLPDAIGREHLWRKFISPKVPGREELDWNKLAELTDGFSGGDIKNAVVNGLAHTATLKPENRRATTDIFTDEIEHVRDAKLNVGNEPIVTTRTISLDDVEAE